MAVPPLIELPSSSCMASLVMSLTRVVAVTESPYTLGQQAFKWPGERWSVSFRMPTITRRDVAADWISFGAKLQGRYGRFLLGDPLGRVPRGVATGSPVVSGAGQTGNSLNTTGWAPSTSFIMRKGDYIQLGISENARLHLVVDDVNSDASGNAVLKIEPALRVSPADGSSIIVNNARGLFRLDSNNFSWSVFPGPQYQLSFEATEVL